LLLRDEARTERGSCAADGLYVSRLTPDVEVKMDWPKRTLWSRIVWLRLCLHYWWARRRRGARFTPGAEPAWWSEFEHAFWSHVDSQSPTPEARRGPRPEQDM